MNANINIEVQIDNPPEGYINFGEFLELAYRLGVGPDWSFKIEEGSCTYLRFHKNDES
jgi:uncharacterized protein YbcV (DUF1398 family)